MSILTSQPSDAWLLHFTRMTFFFRAAPFIELAQSGRVN